MLTTNFNPFPELHTLRLVLREMTHRDDEAMFALRSNPALMQYIDRPLAQTVKDASLLVQKIMDMQAHNEAITWGISLKENATLIGTIGFWRIEKEHYRAEIGYLLHHDFQGQGIMQEAVAAALKYAFSAIRLHSIQANVNPANQASIKLLEKNNFVREAYFKENYFYNGRFLDTAIYSLLNPAG